MCRISRKGLANCDDADDDGDDDDDVACVHFVKQDACVCCNESCFNLIVVSSISSWNVLGSCKSDERWRPARDAEERPFVTCCCFEDLSIFAFKMSVASRLLCLRGLVRSLRSADRSCRLTNPSAGTNLFSWQCRPRRFSFRFYILADRYHHDFKIFSIDGDLSFRSE